MSWIETQKRQLADYSKGADVFSRPDTLGVDKLAKILNKYLDGKTCLDVGCGILPLPGYMMLAGGVNFHGIDPYLGDNKAFPFTCALAEELPFADSSFDGVLFASSIDHVKCPAEAAREAERVLSPGGYIIIWGTFRKEQDPKYRKWLKTKDINIFKHPWAFTDKTVIELFTINLIETVCINHKHRVFVLQK